MKNIIRPLKTIVLALVIGLSIGYVMAWSAPTAPPPGANVPAPVNIGNSTQYKTGSMGIKGLFQTDTDTYLATNGGKVGIGTDNPQSALDVVNRVIIEGNGSPRLGLVDTQLGDVTSAPAWWIDNNNDTFRIFREPNISTSGREFLTIKNNGDTTVNGNMTAGGTITTRGDSGDINMGGNLITGGTNSWIFHTPDDGRTDLFIAPKTNGAWDWGNELRIENNGNMHVNGNLDVSGGMDVSGDIKMNGGNINNADWINGNTLTGSRLHIGSTNRNTWPRCSSSFGGDIRFNGGALYVCSRAKTSVRGNLLWGWHLIGNALN